MRGVNSSNLKLKVLIIAAVILFSTVMVSQTSAQADTPATYIIPMEDWIRNDDVGVIRLVNMLLEEEVPVMWAQEAFTAGGVTYPAGTFYFQTPFTTRLGATGAETVAWLAVEAKAQRVWRIDATTDVTFTANATQLVAPRICLFYDTTTYLNALVHYQKFQSMGFKVQLANAIDIYSKWWNASGSILSESNVFTMPGGAVHLYSFPAGKARTNGIGNITEFIKHGGGYTSTCAGTTESLMNTPYTALDLVNATYSYQWFSTTLGRGLNDYTKLIGPISLNVTVPNHPVMFGYGPTAVRPGYDRAPVYYYGGPAMYDVGTNATILATFGSPITQLDSPYVHNIWGSAAIVTAIYGEGHTVGFSPHPEWPGPTSRLYAQALYFVSRQPKASSLEPSSTIPASITADRVSAITSTVAQIKPVLEETMRVATSIVNLRVGDHYHELGIFYDSSVTTYAHDIYEQLNDIQRSALRFQYEFYKLNSLKAMVTDPTALAMIDEAQGMIESWFNLTENLPSEPHVIPSTDYTGMGPFTPFGVANEATNFTGLVSIFEYINNETITVLLPLAQNYSVRLQEYNEVKYLNQTAYTPEVNATMFQLFNNISATAIKTRTMNSFSHTLKIMQYKIDYHLLNIITIGDRTREILSFVDHALAGLVGAWSYGIVELQAYIVYPGARFL